MTHRSKFNLADQDMLDIAREHIGDAMDILREMAKRCGHEGPAGIAEAGLADSLADIDELENLWIGGVQ